MSVPYRPFVGTLGVAPAGEPVLSFRQGAEFMGNVDLPEIAARRHSGSQSGSGRRHGVARGTPTSAQG